MILLRFAIALTLVVIAGCGGGASSSVTDSPTSSPTADAHLISGQLDLLLSGSFPSGRVCTGTNAGGGYDDIVRGAIVTVKNENGTVIATGSLTAGTTVPAPKYYAATYCQFSFMVDSPTAGFYTIEVSHRGGLTYSYAQLSANNWAVALTLGQ